MCFEPKSQRVELWPCKSLTDRRSVVVGYAADIAFDHERLADSHRRLSRDGLRVLAQDISKLASCLLQKVDLGYEAVRITTQPVLSAIAFSLGIAAIPGQVFAGCALTCVGVERNATAHGLNSQVD